MEYKVACVTGASGFIASWLVKFLLLRNYTVRATVRTLSDPTKVAHLKELEGAEERLHLFEADLVDEGAFDSVVDGCQVVFHTASPVVFQAADPQKEIIDPAVKGTMSVLNACKKATSVRRVIITSSMSTVLHAKNPPRPDLVDESWFSDPTLCRERKGWYSLSKTLAEETAWEFAKENGIDLVTLHPGFVFGPMLQPTLNSTSKVFIDFIKEGKDMPGGTFGYVDVRNVAEAHILAYENPLSNGRYCLVAKVSNSFQVAEMLKEIFPSLNLHPNIFNNDTNLSYEVSKEKAESLGLKYTPPEVSLKDIIQSLMDKKFLAL